MSRELQRVPPWARATTFVLSLAGLSVSIYLTVVHYEGLGLLVCSTNRAFNCEAVLTSPESSVVGVPVALLGSIQYSTMAVLNSPWGWRQSRYWLHTLRFVLAAVGMAFVLWLLAAELLLIDHICLWCSGVHLITLTLLLIISAVGPSQLGWTRRPNRKPKASRTSATRV